MNQTSIPEGIHHKDTERRSRNQIPLVLVLVPTPPSLRRGQSCWRRTSLSYDRARRSVAKEASNEPTGIVSLERIRSDKEILVRTVAMLSKLVSASILTNTG